jgi:hypothetical protein
MFPKQHPGLSHDFRLFPSDFKWIHQLSRLKQFNKRDFVVVIVIAVNTWKTDTISNIFGNDWAAPGSTIRDRINRHSWKQIFKSSKSLMREGSNVMIT